LESSPVYRRQVVARGLLHAKRAVVDDGLGLLQARYPRLDGAVLARTGVSTLSMFQTQALRELLAEEEREDIHHRDFVFFGWAGSGRTTLVNLLALGGLLHREGALYCVSAEGPLRSLDLDAGEAATATGRHPASQLRTWLDGTDHLDAMQEAYQAATQDRLDHSRRLDVVFTDVRKLSEEILAKATGDARPLLQRLRYVVIDHPDRLPREELVRLRVAIARLRLTAELYGRKVTFVVLLPRLENKVRFAKWLLNNQDVAGCDFEGAFPRAELVGWMPPFEVREVPGRGPRFVRADFAEEVTALLAELGFSAQRLVASGESPVRLAVVDAQPLLGPELRTHVRVTAIRRLQEAARQSEDEGPIVLRQEWRWFSTDSLAVPSDQRFDVIVCVGVGSHPELRVSSLRAALAEDGALVLVGDGSPEDYESLREVRKPGWDPDRAIADVRYSSVLWPDHSGAVIAHELASLFEDFRDKPVPRERLSGVFPGEQTERLLEQWLAEGKLEELVAFETLREGRRPEKRPYLRRKDPSFKGQSYEVLWGCCSRAVYGVFDKDARNEARSIGVSRSAYVDRDRLFVDLFPWAMIRHKPHTVQVDDREDDRLSERDRALGAQRWLRHGRLLIGTPDWSAGVTVDRRRPRFAVSLASERPFDGMAIPRDLPADAVQGCLATDDTAAAQAIAAGLRRVLVSSSGGSARLRVATGNWVCQLEETMRDVAFTRGGLVEEPDFVGFRELTPALRERMTRSYGCVGTSLFLELSDRGRDELGTGWFDQALLDQRPAHLGLSRCVQLYLERRFVRFETEYRLALVPNAGATMSGFRLLVHRLREDELHPDEHLSRTLRDGLDALFVWVHERLEACDCDDGCSACCGGLGVMPLADYEHGHDSLHYGPGDVISRKGAYLLACAVLGREPDWRAYLRRCDGDDGLAPLTDAALQGLVRQVIGTEAGAWTDGLWSRDLFGEQMAFAPTDVASVQWMVDDDPRGDGSVGFYVSGHNEIHLRAGRTEEEVLATLVHELTHNWQFTNPGFDRAQHLESDEARSYFAGHLVLEGHARWADHQYRLHAGMGAIYTPTEAEQWDAYKVGYYLMQGIEQALGRDGLFWWLRHGNQAGEAPPRSRNPRLTLPFTLTEALDALGLLSEAREGVFDGIDVVIGGPPAEASADDVPAATEEPDEPEA